MNILAIDLGSSKTTAIIAKKEDTLSISGVGIAETKGVKKGAIVNIDQAAKSIKKALTDAKRVAGIEINKAIVSISSVYLKSITSYGIVNVPEREITIKEINRAIQTALYNANIPSDYELLQALPYNFKVDELSEIEDPAGMSGSRLEVALHIIVAQKSGIENLKKAFKQAGVEIENIVATSYASALAVLQEDEKELGVALIDIGATTADLAIFVNKALRYIDYLGVGSHHITNDLSIALHTPLFEAEEIKVNFGKFVKNNEDLIEISTIGDKEKQKASIDTITQIIIARIEETFMILNKKIENSNLKSKIGAGIVLTGGFTNFYNLKEIALSFFEGFPVRIAYPKEIDGLFENLKKPEFATPIGLVLYAIKEDLIYEIDSNRNFRSRYSLEEVYKPVEKETEEKEEVKNIIEMEEPSILQKFKNWLNNLF